MATRGRPRKPVDLDELKQLSEDADNPLTLTELREHFKVSDATLYTRMREAGLLPRPESVRLALKNRKAAEPKALSA